MTSPENHQLDEFLHEHEAEVRQFIDLAYSQLDNLSDEINYDDGRLNASLNTDNTYAAKWQTFTPKLPDNLKPLLPFGMDELVEINARYDYGKYYSYINVGISSIEDEPKHFSLILTLGSDGQVMDLINTVGSDDTQRIKSDQYDALNVMDAIFAGNEIYAQADKNLGLGDRFKLGIATQPDYGAEQYTVEHGEKIYAMQPPSGGRTIMNGFRLELWAVDRSHPDGKPSRLRVKLHRPFWPEQYHEGIYEGGFEQELEVVQDAQGKITAIKRHSEIYLTGEPIVVNINGKDQLTSMASEGEQELPEDLAKKLYPNGTPTLEDLSYFSHLISEPINAQDLYI